MLLWILYLWNFPTFKQTGSKSKTVFFLGKVFLFKYGMSKVSSFSENAFWEKRNNLFSASSEMTLQVRRFFWIDHWMGNEKILGKNCYSSHNKGDHCNVATLQCCNVFQWLFLQICYQERQPFYQCRIGQSWFSWSLQQLEFQKSPWILVASTSSTFSG